MLENFDWQIKDFPLKLELCRVRKTEVTGVKDKFLSKLEPETQHWRFMWVHRRIEKNAD